MIWGNSLKCNVDKKEYGVLGIESLEATCCDKMPRMEDAKGKWYWKVSGMDIRKKKMSWETIRNKITK